ncbi:MAG: methyltransferase domain-containing protein [Proteobacteria bacterium]|nr:methyltransferase domain-containing protein [Pseudomonadota bacterium]
MSPFSFPIYERSTRWASYWTQLKWSLSGPEGPVLLVGIGSGTTERELRARREDVRTLDIDQGLAPDVTASVEQMPFEDGTFAVAVCCQVLEHLPWESFATAAAELRRVTHGRLVMSVPDVHWYVGLSAFAGVRILKRSLRIDLPRLTQRRLRPDSAHCWEVGRGRSAREVRGVLEGAGWSVTDEFRDEANPYHRFFIAR